MPLAFQYSPAHGQLLMGRQIRNSLSTFHTQLDPQWPDMQSLLTRETTSELKQQSTLNSRHRAMPLTPIEPSTERHIKDLQHAGIVVKAAETPRSYEVKTPTSTIRRNSAHLTPLPEQKQQQPTQEKTKILTPVKTDIADAKAVLQALPTTPILATRPKRLIKPSLKVGVNLGVA